MTTAEFARQEGYEAGYAVGFAKGRADYATGFLAGLADALGMANEQATHEPFLGMTALHTFAAALRERIAAGGAP